MGKLFEKIRCHIGIILIAFVLAVVFSTALSVYAAGRNRTEPEPNKGTKEYKDTDKKTFDDPGTTYIIHGQGSLKKDGNYFTVKSNKSSEGNPIVIILDNVNRSQEGKSPDKSFITIESGNYVIIKLRGNNYIKAGEDKQVGSNDGMAGIHVSDGSTVKVTSENGDGSTSGSLEVYGGGGKYGGAGIGTRYNDDTGSIIIAGGTIRAYGGHCAAGIGSGRDGKAKKITITGGDIYAEGGQYAAGIGAGDNVGSGQGGNLVDINITGGNITAVGGDDPSGDYEGGAGIGCSEGGSLEGTISISNATIKATGSAQAAGIGGGEGGSFEGSSRIIIYSGNIEAKGGSDGAGIGGGDGHDNVRVFIDQTSGEDLYIKATGGRNAAGIGAGDEDGKEISINLRGGKIVAYGGENGSAIGAGDNIDKITITGTGTIEAYGGRSAAGIGGGNDSTVEDALVIRGDTDGSTVTRGAVSSSSARGLKITAIASYGTEPGNGYDNEGAAIGGAKATCGNITIENAVLSTRADEQGADIGGGGFHVTPGGTIDKIVIRNCEISSSSKRKVTPTIGAGYGGTVNKIEIYDTKFTGGGIGGSTMDRNYRGMNSMDYITIDNSDIHAEWDEENPGHFESQITPLAGPLDHGAAGIGSGQFGSIDDITITNSKIYAHGYGSGAGIGGGGAGGQNFSLLNFNKYDIGDVGTIDISNSTVEAWSGCARFKDMPPTIINDGYMDYNIDPIDYGGGAGIGSGSASGISKINIHNCDSVYAYSYRGSGIGSGCATGVFKSGWVDHIWLEDINSVEAYGGEYCTGIGTGGGAGFNGSSGDDLIEIYIKNVKSIKANGGWGGAGIGLGYTSRYKSGSYKGERNITIIDSNIEAKGGRIAAGIGGGAETANFTGYGGDNPPILISGKCRIDAYGGASELYENENGVHGGGAGIGGGNCGGASFIEIRLTEDATTPNGTISSPGKSNYYVHAVGGKGAAGIGSGGNDWVSGGALVKNSADSDSILISSGAVFAKGGDSTIAGSAAAHGDFYIGAGCGIGGASAEANVWSMSIEGGYVVAQAGWHYNENDQADDIGTGGDYSKADDHFHRKSGNLFIEDGTVIAEKYGDFEKQAIVEGGSITGVIPHATKKDKSTNLYRTTLKLADSPLTKVTVKPGKTGYKTDHIYTDSNRKLYLYLPKGGSETDKSQIADITVNNDTRHYIGYTNDAHTGVLKMENQEISFFDPGVVRKGNDFELKLDDASGWDGAEWTFSVEGSANRRDTGTKNVSPGAVIALNTGAAGSYTVNATSPYTSDSEVYWGSKGTFKGNVLKPLPEIKIVGKNWQYYDGEPAEAPSVSTDSKGAVTYQWYTLDGKLLDGAPIDTGSYKVTATVAETEEYDTATSKPEDYTVFKGQTELTQYASQDGAGATILIELQGVYKLSQLPEGVSAKVTVYDQYGGVISGYSEKQVPFESSGDMIVARLDCSQVAEGTYKVKASADLGSNNYYDPFDCERTYNKDKAIRAVNADNVTLTYGDSPYTLSVAAVPEGSMDKFKYSIISDTADQLSERIGKTVEPTISITPVSQGYGNNSAVITANHAGKARVMIELDDDMEAYETAVKYIDVEVKPAKLTVSSYAFVQNNANFAPLGAGENATPVTSVTYGKIGTLGYDIAYSGLVNGDTPENFTHGYGTLEAVPLLEHISASDTPAQVGIRRVPVDATVDGKATKLFYSRDYDVVFDTQTNAVTVNKAKLALQALDTDAFYGEAAPKLKWDIASNQEMLSCDGLTPWDTIDDALTKEPVVTLDKTVTGGKDFPKIDAGTYINALKLSAAESNNYELVYVSGNLTITPADISNPYRIVTNVDDTVYNAAEQKQDVDIVDRFIDNNYTLVPGRDFTVRYSGASLVFAGEVDVRIDGKGNYTGTRYESYMINPRSLSVQTESDKKIYDGTPLTAGGSVDGIVDSDKGNVKLVVTGSQTEVGRSDNTYEITYADANYEASYEVAEEQLGSLYVATNDVARCFVSKPTDVTYDGNEQRQQVSLINMLKEEMTEGVDYELVYSDDIVDAGTVNVTVNGIGAYSGTTSVSYDIKPAPLKVDTDEKIKEYDGTPLTAGGEIYGLVNNETATLQTTGTITDAGSVPNTYVIIWDGTAKEYNYSIADEDIGKLYITPSSDGQNGVDAEGYTGVYDGLSHGISAVAFLDGSTLSYSTDGGKTWSKDAPVYKDATDEPVNVMIKAENPDYAKGTATVGVQVSISKAPLTVQTESASKQYDGTPLKANGSLSGLVNSETAELAVTGSQTEVGHSVNTYEIHWNGTASESNYAITEKLGTLSVTSAGGDDPKKPDDPSKPNKPGAKTSDMGHPVLYLIIALIGLAGAGVIVFIKKKKMI